MSYSITEPLAKDLSEFSDKLSWVSARFSSGESINPGEIITLFKQYKSYVNKATENKANIQGQLDASTAAEPKKTAVAMMVKMLAYFAKEITNIIKIISSLAKIASALVSLLSSYITNIVTYCVKQAAALAQAATKSIKERAASKAKRDELAKKELASKQAVTATDSNLYTYELTSINEQIAYYKSVRTSENAYTVDPILLRLQYQAEEYKTLLSKVTA